MAAQPAPVQMVWDSFSPSFIDDYIPLDNHGDVIVYNNPSDKFFQVQMTLSSIDLQLVDSLSMQKIKTSTPMVVTFGVYDNLADLLQGNRTIMSGTGLNSRSSSRLRILDNTNLVSAYVTGKGLIGKGDNVNLEGFKEARIKEISNKNGPLEVNNIETVAPLSSTTEDGTATIQLMYNEEDFEVSDEYGISLKEKRGARFPLWIEKEDNVAYIELKHVQPLGTSDQGLTLFTDDSLQIDEEGKLTVVCEEKETYEVPIVKDDHVVRLHIEKPLVINEDGKLTTDSKSIMKGAGAVRVYSSDTLGEIVPTMPDWLDIDLPGDLEDYLQNGMLVKLQVSDDFQQTSGRLALRSHGLYRIPFYSGLSGFDSDANFTYNNTLNILSAPTIHSNVDYNITEPTQVPTAAYIHQLMQSEAGSAVDIGAVANGRKLSNLTPIALDSPPTTLFTSSVLSANDGSSSSSSTGIPLSRPLSSKAYTCSRSSSSPCLRLL
ncbi:hypothetical protein BC832DRAFT_596031 [Gaertneriomyces semiglobifer]|nr:hypothetical protein BC832DRAFT_596031 [Gaertneriomyces semiglobifer]